MSGLTSSLRNLYMTCFSARWFHEVERGLHSSPAQQSPQADDGSDSSRGPFHRSRSQLQLRSHRREAVLHLHGESELLSDHLHCEIVGHHFRRHRRDAFLARHANYPAQQLLANPAILIRIRHDDRDLRVLRAMDPVHPAYANDLRTIRSPDFNHQGKFAIVIAKADSDEPLVGHTFLQAERAEVTQVHAAVGKLLVE